MNQNPSKALALFDLLGGVIKGVILKFLSILGFCLEERRALEFREVIAEFLRGTIKEERVCPLIMNSSQKREKQEAP